jgi:hypothetical protein
MPGLTPRRLTIALGLLVVVGGLLLAGLAASGFLSPAAAALSAGAGAMLAAILVVVIGVRRVDAKVQKVLRENREHRRTTSTTAADAARPLTDLAGRTDAVVREVRDLVRDLQGALGEDRVETAIALTETRNHIDRGLAGLSGSMLAPVGELDAALRGLAATVEPLPDRVDALGDRVGALDQAVGRLPQRVAKPVNASVRQAYEQIEAYVDLRRLIRPRAPLPALAGWAAGPDVLRVVFETLWRDRPELIVECGSGSSSVWLGYAVEQLGTGRVVALEHDERYLAISRDLIRAHRLDEVVEIRHAPLEPWRPATTRPLHDGADTGGAGGAGPAAKGAAPARDAGAVAAEGARLTESTRAERTAEAPDPDEDGYPWYATAQLSGLDGIGLLFVDGPPGVTGPLARYPALPLLLPRCAADAVIVLDDAHRPDERALSDRWLTEFPEVERTARGERIHVLTRRRRPS